MSVRIFPDGQWAEHAASFVADEIAKSLRRSGRCHLMLAGGTTPQPLYRALRAESVDWSQVTVSFGDERCVSPDDPRSNFQQARDSFLDAVVPANGRQVLRMPGEDPDREAAAVRYARDLEPLLPVDVLLLGMGGDGHIASLFPQSRALEERDRLVVPVTAPREPRDRLTITPAVITSAREVLVLVTGPSKATSVSRVMEDDDSSGWPAMLVRDRTWILDESAASGLGGAHVEL